jgi:hypothetical protein
MNDNVMHATAWFENLWWIILMLKYEMYGRGYVTTRRKI